MMTGIVERLRRGVLTHQERRSTELEAAEMIERLLGHIDLLHGEIEHQRERITWLQEQLEELQKERKQLISKTLGINKTPFSVEA